MLPACTFVIFGATGDLTKRKLIPALYRLHRDGKLHPKTKIVAIGRRDYTDADMLREFLEHIDDRSRWKEFSARISYQQLDFEKDAGYSLLAKRIGAGLRIFYFATSPDAFPVITQQLRRHGIARKEADERTERLVFEKPFGTDYASAKRLNDGIRSLFFESQVYRIDHYLGKEIVQNIMALRFTNPLFKDVWNAKSIDHVQIVVTETLGIGDRGKYYDTTGVLKDMVQNHLLQLLTLTTMEEPETLRADDIRSSKVRALKAVGRRGLRKRLVLGQYTAGTIGGAPARGYRSEKDVKPSSATPTYAAMKLDVASPRWKGVPFYLRTGKALKNAYAQIVVQFRIPPCGLFCGADGRLAPNTLVIRIQPDEGLELQFNLKEHDAESTTVPLTMQYVREAEFRINSTEAYERLLSDVMAGDQTLFTRWDEVAEQWRITDALVAARAPLRKYAAGSAGPKESLDLIVHDKRNWFGNRPLRHYLRSRTAEEKA